MGYGAKGKDRAATDELARSLLDRLADPFFVQGHEVFMTASMGIAYYPDDAPNVIDLIRNADAALYHAKKNGGNEYAFYSMEMNEASVERLMTKSKLKRAFERDELLVHYQPKYNLETGEVFGAEALVEDAVVRNTSSAAQGGQGFAVTVQPDASSGVRGRLELRHSVLERSRNAAVAVLGAARAGRAAPHAGRVQVRDQPDRRDVVGSIGTAVSGGGHRAVARIAV